MRKTHKKIFGFFGLVLVATMTFLAACLPSTTTSAATAVTDTITVHVPSNVPDVNITKPSSGLVTTSATQEIKFSHDMIQSARLILIKIDPDETQHEYLLSNYTTSEEPGTETFTLNFNNPNFGYGEFILKVVGTGAGGATDEDSITISHYPVVAEPREDEETGNTVLDLDYDPLDPTGEGDGEVAEIEINVYDKDGNLVTELSPIIVTPPETEVEIPFSEHDLPSGEYTIEIKAKDKDGNELYTQYTTHAIYEAVPVPNTGGLFMNLNISQTDYLITGVIVFMLVGIFGVVFIAKRQRKTGRRR